jgi:asparagine synthase (glutamine-hydrolysing)
VDAPTPSGQAERNPARARLGDFLLVFGDPAPPRRGRTEAPWICLERLPGAVLWAQERGSGWAGLPTRAMETAAGKAWLFGELFGDSERHLPSVIADRLPATELNGHFLLLVHHAEGGEWRLLTSRLGTLHAYVARRAQRVAVGTSFGAVAGVASGKRLDWTALSGFFRCGFFPGDLTPFDDVSLLRPARRYVFSPEGELRAAKRYWTWRHTPDAKRDEASAADELGDLLGRVTADLCADGPVALPLSGGLDSRTLAGALPAEADIWTYSYGWGARSIENKIARRIAAARGLPYAGFTLGPYLFERIEQIAAATEGFQDICQCRQAAVRDELAAQAAGVLAGHWGDVWNDRLGWIERRLPSEDEVVDAASAKLTRHGGAALAELLCRGPLGDDPARVVRGIFQRELRALGHLEDLDFRLKAFKTDQWSARSTTASLRMFQAGAFPRLPYYDNRVVDFYATLPTELVAGRRLQIALLQRRAPDLAAIEWQEAGISLARLGWPPAARLAWRGLRKAGRLLTFERVVERNWQVQLLGPAGAVGLERWLLAPGLRVHDALPPTPMRELVARFQRSRDPALGYQISMLLSFSVFLERA